MGKKELKAYKFDKKSDYIVYLQELIARTDKCLYKTKIYLDELDEIVNELEKTGLDKVSPDIYSRYVDLLGNNTSYLLNLIGDKQKSSISYAKFRLVIDKRKSNDSLDFEIRDLDEKTEFILKDLNKMRNWHNHVPESLLLSEIEMIRTEGFVPHRVQPIEVRYFDLTDIEVAKDLLETSIGFYNVCRIAHQSMKKDYSDLIGESVRIVRVRLEERKMMNTFAPTKLSAEVQGIVGKI
ncbi:MAG: hypothetical protein N4A62_03045 [Marinisporobacter sp.]|jgi:hypothetical protein|nr:hypothetical protein [Marinisporobacter sp.]